MLYRAIRPAFLTLLLTLVMGEVARGADPSTTTLQSSLNPSTLGKSVTLTATITPSTANGLVTFFDGSTVLGTNRVQNGKASITLSSLLSGVRTLHAYFTGDNNTVPSTSLSLKQTVTALASTGFQPIATYSGVTGATFLTTGDFNGDGISDLVVVNPTLETKKVMLLLGQADGSFRQPLMLDGGTQPVAIAVSDLNADGRSDLAIVDAGTSNVIILFGLGDGNFVQGGNYPVALSPSTIVIADFNNDGSSDIAVSTSDGISLLLSNTVMGPGSFLPSVFLNAGLVTSFSATDVNNDGLVDLVIANPNGVAVMLGIGNANFQAKVNYPTGVGGGPIAMADFNGDGIMDVAAAAGNQVSIILGNANGVGNPDGTFKPAKLSLSGAPNAFIQTLAVGDFNGDGKPDLVATNFSGVPSGTYVSVLLGNGDGTFQAPAINNLGLVTAAITGDFNRDGSVDIATVGLGTLGVLLAIPAPIITPPPPTPPSVAEGGVLNAASFQKDGAGHGTAVAPGSLVSVFGNFPKAVQASAATVPFGTSLGGVSVKFNGIAAPMRDVVPAANELNVQIPFGVQPSGAGNTVNVVVTIGDLSSDPVAVPIVPAAPGIFTIPPTGQGNAVVVFVDPADNVAKIAAPVSSAATIGLPCAPVPRGAAAFFYVTGLGALSPPVADGSGGADVTHFATNPIVMVDGMPASVQFAGQAPGFPGVNQVNIVIPSTASTGGSISIQVKSADGSVKSNIASIAVR